MNRFREPNFRCRVAERDRPKVKISRLVYAENAETAQAILEAREYIVFKVRDYKFSSWEKAVRALRRRAAKARGSLDPASRKTFNFRPLWSPLKEVLLDLFFDKCAYCDAPFTQVAYGDVEHFRPKGEVTLDHQHPGYYWLAYDPSNYFPGCQLCNQSKKNNFPIAGNARTALPIRSPTNSPRYCIPSTMTSART